DGIEIVAVGVIPRRRQLVTQTRGKGELGAELVRIVDISRFDVPHVVSIRNSNGDGGLRQIPKQEVGESIAARQRAVAKQRCRQGCAAELAARELVAEFVKGLPVV